MPSGPNYVRNYQHEYLIETLRRRHERAMRNKARRAVVKRLGRQIKSGYDVDHVQPLDKGGNNSQSNLRELIASRNRSYPRNDRGGMR